MTAEEKLAEFKLACRDALVHPAKVDRLWTEFIELVEKEKREKEEAEDAR